MSLVMVMAVVFLVLGVATVTLLVTSMDNQTYLHDKSGVYFEIDSVLNLCSDYGTQSIRAGYDTCGNTVSQPYLSYTVTTLSGSIADSIPENLRGSIVGIDVRTDCLTLKTHDEYNPVLNYSGTQFVISIVFSYKAVYETYEIYFAAEPNGNYAAGDCLGCRRL